MKGSDALMHASSCCEPTCRSFVCPEWTDLKGVRQMRLEQFFEDGIRVQIAGCAKQCEACALWQELPD